MGGGSILFSDTLDLVTASLMLILLLIFTLVSSTFFLFATLAGTLLIMSMIFRCGKS
jgi:hypothetical protein